MGLSDIPTFFGARRRVKVGVRQSYGVTALGKQKAEEFSLSGPRWQVLAYLSENGPSSVAEVTKECSLSDDKAKLILKGLIQNGYVQSQAND